MMFLWRIAYYLLHGANTRVRIELERGRFTYYEGGTLLPHQRRGIEEVLLAANVSRAIVAIKRRGVVVTYGIREPAVMQRIRNITCT